MDNVPIDLCVLSFHMYFGGESIVAQQGWVGQQFDVPFNATMMLSCGSHNKEGNFVAWIIMKLKWDEN